MFMTKPNLEGLKYLNYAHIPRIDYICVNCGYILKNGGPLAKEICPKEKGGCGALDSFVPKS